MEKAILKNWLKAGFIDKYVLHATEEGTPQGGICSPVLANMTLNGLEKELREKFPKHPNSGSNEKINFVRFADDFIVDFQIKRGLRKRGKTCCGAIHEGARVDTLPRENPHHAY
jgi:RNA-directed DNA polymerase